MKNVIGGNFVGYLVHRLAGSDCILTHTSIEMLNDENQRGESFPPTKRGVLCRLRDLSLVMDNAFPDRICGGPPVSRKGGSQGRKRDKGDDIGGDIGGDVFALRHVFT